MESARFLRNKDLINQNSLTDLTIIGAGGIGSHLIAPLSIMGWRNVVLVDYDKIEEHNRSTTCYPKSGIGEYKVDVAEKEWFRYADKDQLFGKVPRKFTPYSKTPLLRNVMVCTDNMESRLDAYNQWVQNDDRGFFIDMRMSALGFEIITATKFYDNYMEHWHDGSDVADDPCTAKHTIFCGGLVAFDGVAQAFLLLQETIYYAYINTTLLPRETNVSEMVAPPKNSINKEEEHNEISL